MATAERVVAPLPSGRRLTEWALMALLLLGLTLSFVRYSQNVRGQAELAALKTTLGSLRTALVVEHLRRQVAAHEGAALPSPGNPFTLLESPPANYVGVVNRAQSRSVANGAWLFAPDCPCVGYRPLDDQWLDSPVDDPLIWFAVTGSPGVLQLVAEEKYRWRNESLD